METSQPGDDIVWDAGDSPGGEKEIGGGIWTCAWSFWHVWHVPCFLPAYSKRHLGYQNERIYFYVCEKVGDNSETQQKFTFPCSSMMVKV